MATLRVTEQVAQLVEISYDIPLTEPIDDDDYGEIENHLDRASMEVHRETIRHHREIIGTEICQ